MLYGALVVTLWTCYGALSIIVLLLLLLLLLLSLQPSVEYRRVWLGLWRGAFTCVGWKVTLCDPIWQVTPRSSEMTCSGTLYCLTFNL